MIMQKGFLENEIDKIKKIEQVSTRRRIRGVLSPTESKIGEDQKQIQSLF